MCVCKGRRRLLLATLIKPSSFSSTKYAVRGLMDALLLELKQLHPDNQVDMTVVHPFVVNTGLAKKPRTRFANLLPFSEASEAAAIILTAVKNNDFEVFVPTNLFYLFAVTHCLPFNVKLALYKFLGVGVEKHENDE